MEKSIKQHLKTKAHDRIKKEEGLFFFGEFKRPVKDGRFSMPKQFRQFKAGEAIAFTKSGDFPFLSLWPRTFEKSLARHKPAIINYVPVGPGGMVNLGRELCMKVFNSLEFNAVLLGAVNGIQLWERKSFSNWRRENDVEMLRIIETVNDERS